MTTVLGVDPSTVATGYSVWRDGRLLVCGVITPRHPVQTTRAQEVVEALAALLEQWRPDAVGIERLPTRHAGSSEVWSLANSLKQLCRWHKVPVELVTPAQWRRSIVELSGNAQKADVLAALRMRYHDEPWAEGLGPDALEAAAIGEYVWLCLDRPVLAAWERGKQRKRGGHGWS